MDLFLATEECDTGNWQIASAILAAGVVGLY